MKNNFDVAIPALLEKSKREKTEENYPVRIGISSESPDKKGDIMVLKSIFTPDEIDYHMKEGYADFDHLSFRGKTPLEKAQAICGKPVDFEWGKHPESGIPMAVVEVNLFRGNPYNERAIIPALEHGNGVFSASIGGLTLQKSEDIVDKKSGKKYARITKIRWIHDAITPKYKAVNGDTFLEKITKSLGAICHGAVCRDDIESIHLIKSFDGLVEWTEKSFIANDGGTNYAAMSGGAALQPQSLEGDDRMQKVATLDSVVNLLKSGMLNPEMTTVKIYLQDRGFTADLARECAKLILFGGR